MIIKSKEKELILGMIKEFTKETGKLIKWMVLGNLLGLMVENM